MALPLFLTHLFCIHVWKALLGSEGKLYTFGLPIVCIGVSILYKAFIDWISNIIVGMKNIIIH